MLIVGDKEREEGTVSVRKRDEGDIGALTKKDFIARVLDVYKRQLFASGDLPSGLNSTL